MPVATSTKTMWSLDVVKSHVKASTNNLDAKIAQLADGVSSRIEEYLRRKVTSQSVIEVLDGPSRGCPNKIVLQNYPVLTVDELKTRAGLGYTYAVVSASTYELDTVHGWIYMINGFAVSYAFPAGQRTIQVTYTAGYGAQDSAAIPRDIYTVGLDYCKFVYDRWKSDLSLAESLSEGGRNISLTKDLPADVKNALSHHVKRRL